jgi:hypothetical protein
MGLGNKFQEDKMKTFHVCQSLVGAVFCSKTCGTRARVRRMRTKEREKSGKKEAVCEN